MSRVVVPPSAGLFSSFGLLYADVEHHYSRTFRRLLRQADLAEIERAWERARRSGARRSSPPRSFAADRMRLRRSAALHYQGQSYELTVPVPDGPIDEHMVGLLEEAFGQEHEKTYGHRAGKDEPVELVSIQIVGQGLRQGSGIPEQLKPSRAEPQPPPPRRAYFGDAGWLETPILRRSDLAAERSGPMIIEEYDATCVVPPDATASLDSAGNIVIAPRAQPFIGPRASSALKR